MLNLYFSREEFACKCGCGFSTVDTELLQILTNIRVHFGKPVIISSGCRCETHNEKVGGLDISQHLLGRAADITVRDVDIRDVAAYVLATYPYDYGIGVYRTFLHIDSRSHKARW